MADVEWIKIKTDIFDDEKILLIESLPNAYAIITVWFKLLCLAGKQNNSGVFMMGKIAYTDKMLATIFRMKEATVTMALQTFEQFGMIETVENVITIPNWGKHQNTDRLQEIKEYNRLAKQKSREKQKLLQSNVNDKSMTSQSNVNDKSMTSQSCQDTGIEKEKREKIIIYIVEYLNTKLGSHYKANSCDTALLISTRLSEGFTVDDFKTVIDKKCEEWIGTDMAKYLRPSTLFGAKFEAYLNTPISKSVFKEKEVSFDVELAERRARENPVDFSIKKNRRRPIV